MSFDFQGLTYPSIKNLVSQMSNVDAVRFSLQSAQADEMLKTGGKTDVSFFKLSSLEISRLSGFDKLELLLCEAGRSNSLQDWNLRLSCSMTEQFFYFGLECADKDYKVTVCVENLEEMNQIPGIRKSLKFGNELVPTVTLKKFRGRKQLILFWEDKTAGLISILNFFNSKFNLGLRDMKFGYSPVVGPHSESIRRIVEYLNSNNVKILEVTCDHEINQEDYKFILENLTPTFALQADAKTSPDFKFHGQIRAERIIIHSGNWFTLDALLKSANCQCVIVASGDYTKEELVTFLEHLKNGEFPELKQLKLGTKVDVEDVVKDFEKLEGYETVIKGPGDSYVPLGMERNMLCFNL